MLYTFFILLLGVYIGQDYNLPSIKSGFMGVLEFTKTLKKEDYTSISKNDNQGIWYNLYKKYF